jgi:peptide/nickel transport system substrate-binding protein
VAHPSPERRNRTGRTRTALVLVALALPAGLAGCSSSSSGTTTAASGGTLRFATDQQPACLNPQVSNQDITAVVDRNVVDSLVSMAPDGKFSPWLATRWSVSPSGTTYTFTLRTGVKFSDGTPLNAAAVKDTLDYAVNPATKSQYAASLLGPFKSATAVNPTTLVIQLSAPYAPLLAALSTPFLGIQSPKSLTAPNGELCQHVTGSGPFELVSFTPNVGITLRRNPAYDWGPASAAHTGPARLASITISFVTDDSVRVGALTSGQVNVADDIPPSDASSVSGNGSLTLSRVQAPGTVYALYLNSTSGVFADQRVREAFLRAIDLNQLVSASYFGEYQRAWSLLGPTTVGYDAALAGSWPANLSLANQLLNEAGWTGRDAAGYRTKDGVPLVVRWPYATATARSDRTTLGQAIQAEEAKVGFDVQFKAEDAGTFIQQTVNDTGMDAFATSFESADPSILGYWFASDETTADGGGNVFRLDSPQLDQWLSKADATGDQQVRDQYYALAQQYIISQALAMPVYVPTDLVGAAKSVHGLAFSASGYPEFYDAWLAG